MKSVILIRDGRIQLVLTPETEHEKGAMQMLGDDESKLKAKLYKGSFYECQGGWERQSKCQESIMIVCDKEES